MRAHWILILFVVSIISACGGKTKVAPKNPSPQFDLATATFFNEFWELYPMYALHAGNHRYDNRLTVPSQAIDNRRMKFIRIHIGKLSAISDDTLNMNQRMDKKLLINALNEMKWTMEVLKPHQWDPSRYNIGNSIGMVMQGKLKTTEQKLVDIEKQLILAPSYYQAAAKRLVQPTKEHTQHAIKQNKGTLTYLSSLKKKHLEKSKLSNRKKSSFRKTLEKAQEAIDDYVTFLEEVKNNPAKVGGFRSFRIGSELYKTKYAFETDATFTADGIYQMALKERAKTHEQMIPLAEKLWDKYLKGKEKPADKIAMVGMVIKEISKSHVKPKEFITAIRKQLPELTAFVKEKDLLYLDPSKPLEVRETPLYMRGFAGASIDAPGPFEKERQTFYNVTPLVNMSTKQKESYLREYNDYTLQILNIHEAIPGHYAQLVYSNQSPSMVKTIFGSGAMVEGWAVYSERMMLEEGYGNNSPELWLMYHKWYLRVVTNTIIDYEIHNKQLSRKDALKQMMVDAFQEKEEAEKKWNRATLSQVQLTYYFTGFYEIYSLRQKVNTQLKDNFKLRAFHEKFLSFGRSPVKEISKVMLNKTGA